jgi:hypothetical protein
LSCHAYLFSFSNSLVWRAIIMSLVDYASSSDDDIEENQPEQEEQHGQGSSSRPSNQSQTSSEHGQQSEAGENSSIESMIELPDASELLKSLAAPANQTGSDHSSRVATAMAASASRKRPETNGFASLPPHRKLPRGNLPPSRIPPDTSGGLLIPPQLRGRSNVVTEDIEKLFVRRKKAQDDSGEESIVQ